MRVRSRPVLRRGLGLRAVRNRSECADAGASVRVKRVVGRGRVWRGRSRCGRRCTHVHTWFKENELLILNKVSSGILGY